jgi:cation:H+ antiporter
MTSVVHPVLVFLGGLVVIILGAELMLRAAQRFALRMGLKPIVIGLTVVAVGTSAPELAVGVKAVLEGRGPLAVGNIAGTNIVNMLLILGLSAALRPLPLQLMSIRLDVPVMIAATLALFAMSLDGVISRFDGFVLIAGSIPYFVALLRLTRKESPEVTAEFDDRYGQASVLDPRRWLPRAWDLVLLVAGIALTVLGANLLVAGAVDVARAWGFSDAVIGLTIVAIGTSAPELASTVVSTWKNDRDVAVGNLIGSNITNILVILGITALVPANGIAVGPDVLLIDLPLALSVAIICLPVFRSDRMVSRREGIAFVTAYVIYLAVLLVLRT